MRLSQIASLFVAALVMLGGACDSSTAPQSNAQFVLDAPLCSSVLPVQFFVDGALVGQDTFRIHLTAEHTASRLFPLTAGAHRLGARTTGQFVYVWSDTLVTAAPPTTIAVTLPFYCS